MPKEKKAKGKKKGKKDKKKKGAGTGKNKDAGTKKKKEPTEKELFEIQVERKKHELEVTEKRLKERNTEWQQTMDLLEKQVDRKEASVSHLKELLSRGRERYLAAHDRLQEERELAELVERRVTGKVSTASRSADAARSLFLQQKMELEGKLSLLEELRLKRNSLKAQLKRAEAALEEQESSMRTADRDDDSTHVGTLLRNSETFLRMCARTRAEWRSAFDIRLSVLARRKLGENLRLRGECRTETDRLLSEQELRRSLGEQFKAAQLEREIRESADQYIASRSSRLEEDIRRLKQEVDELVLETSPERVIDKQPRPVNKEEESFRDRELEYCRLLDRSGDVSAILRDQSRYRASLERDAAIQRDKNDAMFSAIHRARRVFRERCSSDSAPPEGVDFEVLRQIRRLLDLGQTGAPDNWLHHI